jgi:ectoine hydroxylase-related dioxygenase (phytanoyl-CoA dioxygenase family)
LAITVVEPTMTTGLTHEQVAAYRRDGYLSALAGLTAVEAAAWRDAVEAFGRRHGVREALVLRNKAHLKMPALAEIVTDARILDRVEAILGPDILCWGSSLFIKEPGGPETVAWHQDAYYWDMTPDDVCVVWLALIESTEENGAMRVVPGSHATVPVAHRASPDGSPNMLFTYEEAAVEVEESATRVCRLAAGELSIHHMGLLHGSGANRSAGRRMGYSITYLAPHVRHGGKRNSAMLVRGQDRHGHFAADPVPTAEMQPEICAFVDAPFGGGLPVAARAERPAQDFYRRAAQR